MATALSAWSGRAHAGAAVGRTGSGTGTTSAITITMTGALTSGSLLVGIVTQNSVGGVFGTIVPPAGWTCPSSLASAQSTKVQISICYLANNTSTGSTVGTWSVGSTTGTKFGVQVGEFTGVTTTSPLDGTGTNSAAASSAITVSATSSAGGELAVAAFANDDSSNPASLTGTTFTTLGSDISTSGAFNAHGSYALSNPQGAVSETANVKAGKKPNLAAVMATFVVPIPTYYWLGGSAGCPSGSTWSTGACWSASSGGAPIGGTPGATNAVMFDSGGTGDCSINAAATAMSLTLASGYTGTVTHSSGNVVLSGALTVSSGTFTSTASSSSAIRTNPANNTTYVGDLIIGGGAFASNGAVLGFRSISESGSTSSLSTGTSTLTTNSSGTVTLSGGTASFGTGALTLAGSFTVGGSTATIASPSFAPPAAVTVSSGSLTFGSGTVAFGSGLAISGTGAVTLGTGATQTATTISVSSTSSSALTFATGSTFTSTDVFSQSAGTVTANNATLAFGTGVASGDGFSMTGGTFNGGTSTLSVGVTGKNGGQSTTINGSGATFNGTSGTQHFYGALNVTAGTATLGTADMAASTHSTAADQLVSVGASGFLNLTSSFSFASTNTMTLAGKINGGTGTVTFAGPVTLTGTYDAQQSTTTFGAAVTMTGSSVFWGGSTATTTFSVAPTLTAGTFQVGSNGATGSVILTAGATFASGMTLAFPTSGGTLSTPGGQTLTINGTVTSSAGAIASRPKISRSSGTTGITVTFGATSVLNVDGLEFDNVAAAGVTILDGATYTLLKDLKFQNNAAGGTSTGTHLAITSSNPGGTKVLQIPGCSFDATAQYNVTLSGVSGSTGVRAVLEFQSTSVNGARGGPSYDLDADTNGDNVADSTTANRYGAVVEWVAASSTDTAGTAVGYPTAAFDWNTFQWYGVYVAYKDSSGTTDVVYRRNLDGSPSSSFSIAQTSGDIVGTPTWDTIDETVANVDADGDGLKTNTDVRVLYIPTSTGHIIKLVDTSGTLARPGASSPWASDFTDSNVSTITSALANDGTNLYFGGTGSSTTKVFGVQVAGGTNEAKLVKNIGSVSAVNTTPSYTVSGGVTYLFLGSTATSNQSYIYRINATAGAVDASYSGATTNINGAIVLTGGRAYAASDGGKVYALDALNFSATPFPILSGFPYTTKTTAGVPNPVEKSPWVDNWTLEAFFGDDGGYVYDVTAAGADTTNTGGSFPLLISASIKITSTPLYINGHGVIAVGASDGNLYFIDRNDGTKPNVFKRYFVSATGSVSTVSYDNGNGMFMVSSSDGKLTFVNGSDVTDPTPGSI